MRDILILGVFIISLFYALRNPLIAVLVYYGVSIMSPHRFSWGFVYYLPLAFYASIIVFISIIIHYKQLRFPRVREIYLFLIFWIYMTISTKFAIYPDSAWLEWESVTKIFLMTFITMLVITTRKQLLIYTLSIIAFVGVFAVKGAIFGIMTAGQYKIWGPPDSFLEDNNFIGLAFVIIIPLCFFIRNTIKEKWVSITLLVTGISAILSGVLTYSRGALLGLASIGVFYLLKAKNKVFISIAVVIILSVGINFLPSSWFDRMNSIKNYQHDRSAQQRINSWIFSYRMAKEHFWGGGFDCFTLEQYILHSPDPYLSTNQSSDGTYVGHTSHSIYFEVLAQQGFPGLIFYLAPIISVLMSIRFLDIKLKSIANSEWIHYYSRGYFISIIGFLVCGAFISRAFFELFWTVFAGAVSLKTIVLSGNWIEGIDETFIDPVKSAKKHNFVDLK